jgi:hypothetical protein
LRPTAETIQALKAASMRSGRLWLHLWLHPNIAMFFAVSFTAVKAPATAANVSFCGM